MLMSSTQQISFQCTDMSPNLTIEAQDIADFVDICLKVSMATFIPVKNLLENHVAKNKTYISCHIIVDLIVGSATSLGLKKIDNQSPSYD